MIVCFVDFLIWFCFCWWGQSVWHNPSHTSSFKLHRELIEILRQEIKKYRELSDFWVKVERQNKKREWRNFCIKPLLFMILLTTWTTKHYFERSFVTLKDLLSLWALLFLKKYLSLLRRQFERKTLTIYIFCYSPISYNNLQLFTQEHKDR